MSSLLVPTTLISSSSPLQRQSNRVSVATLLPNCSRPRFPNLNSSSTFCVKKSYVRASIQENYKSAPIDVVADVKAERVCTGTIDLDFIVVLGGSGFVGSAICKAAVSKGIEAICAGDVFYTNWDEILVGATAVVSTIGGFGVPKFILISVHDYNLPPFLLSSGYFTGKRKAESEVLSKYPNSGAVLRPGFIYGKRKVNGFEIPLDYVAEPLEKFLKATENFTKPLNSLPASDLLLAPPVSVDDVAYAVINAVLDDDFFGIFTIEQIKEAAEKVRS
ncbi:hypothetical protein Syun_018146 [Stephania yunnanensis]|uniref:NAD(P)-binding domain-containing protein n=1 Tax=Stephania yunnanensis TaxID=152371 RepID=A0AAP0IRU7_9MAGN